MKRHLSATFLLGLLAATTACTPTAAPQAVRPLPAEPPTRPGPRTTVVELPEVSDTIVARTNALRRDKGLRPLEVDRTLEDTARDFARFMARSDRYGHGADGRDPIARAERHGYRHCILAENIAYRQSSFEPTTSELAEDFFRGWLESPGHREKMLDRDVTETAVACAQSARTGRHYAVQLLGRPRSQEIGFRVRNGADTTLAYVLDGQRYELPVRFTRIHRVCRPPILSLDYGVSETEQVWVPKDGDRLLIQQPSGERVHLLRE